MLENKFLLWFAMIFPLVFSAGPANVTMASLGARFGFARTLPFIVGINLIVLLQSLLIGFGAGAVLQRYPAVYRYLQYGGALYLLYLASKFLRASRVATGGVADNAPCFTDGVILQLLNMKVVTVMMVMFSKFIDTRSSQVSQVILLSVGLTSLTGGATMTWAVCGAWLTRLFASKRNVRLQGYVFGGMLVGVAVWMLVETIRHPVR
ncbi:MAG: LysE family translocator [Desulfovibrionaceae bacterium]|jgi:threonine/homoserine/homoserine lactone efflux protein|nr:LysE family translocator [Desulfovibrionaceae bacterium]